jgi:hypothetical protein
MYYRGSQKIFDKFNLNCHGPEEVKPNFVDCIITTLLITKYYTRDSQNNFYETFPK